MQIVANDYPMNKVLLFLFSGKAGVGKTFSAQNVEFIGGRAFYNVKTFSFASGVKKVAHIMGWDGVKDAKGRCLLQRIGQAGRAYDPNMWVSATVNYIHNSRTIPYDIVCIDDWRFQNEYHYIKNTQPLFKVVSIRIESPEREVLKGTPEYDEISERDLDNFELFDYVIGNPEDNPQSLLDSLTNIVGTEILKNR